MDNRPFDEILKSSVNTTRNYTFEEADWLMLKKQLPKKVTLWQKYWAWMVGSLVIGGLVFWNIMLHYQVKHLNQIIAGANIIQEAKVEQEDTALLRIQQVVINKPLIKNDPEKGIVSTAPSLIGRKIASTLEFPSLSYTSELDGTALNRSPLNDYASHRFYERIDKNNIKNNSRSTFQLDSLEEISIVQNSLEKHRVSDQEVSTKSLSNPHEKKDEQYIGLEKIPTIPLGSTSIYKTAMGISPSPNINSFFTNDQQKRSADFKKQLRIKVGASFDISTSGNNSHVVTSQYTINTYSNNWAYGLSAGMNILPHTSLELGLSNVNHSSVHAPANVIPVHYPQVNPNNIPDNAQLQYANVDIEHIQFSLALRKQWLVSKKAYPYAELGWMPYRAYSSGRISYTYSNLGEQKLYEYQLSIPQDDYPHKWNFSPVFVSGGVSIPIWEKRFNIDMGMKYVWSFSRRKGMYENAKKYAVGGDFKLRYCF